MGHAGADLAGAVDACSTPVLICGVTPSSTTSRASIPTGVPAESSAGIVKRSERAAQTSAIAACAHSAPARPPKNDATTGAAASAIPPNPTHSITAESPMSRAAS